MYPYFSQPMPENSRDSILYAQTNAKKLLPSQPDKRLLHMLSQAASDETADAGYYKKLSESTKQKDDALILHNMHLDELKHKSIFMDLYFQLTGTPMPKLSPQKKELGGSKKNEYQKSLFDELEAVEFYRQILFALTNQEMRDMLFEVITDEQNHGTKLLYLLVREGK